MAGVLDAVGRTSLLTAAMRAEETRRPDRLYTDPYAETLCGDLGPALLAELQDGTHGSAPAPVPAAGAGDRNGRHPMPRPLDVNAIRTRYFDDRLLLAARDVPQIVSAASGMDARAYRLHWPPGLRYFEIDRAAVLAYKRDRLADAVPRAEHRAVAADLTSPDWEARLVDAGYDPALPSAWLLEGMLYYLPEEAVCRLLDRIRRITAPGSVLAADLVNAAGLTLPQARGQLDVFARWGCPWQYGADDPEALFAAHGFTAHATQPDELSAAYGRWIAPSPPPAEQQVRRVFLVEGRRG
ncbi:SAM-dependent methyltransferase [Streptomyces sp. MUM 178J]|uniref:SAM-dependent methyltransferase n=1 Tax=Streptomyces sp. MUM 178J TaxID=2791991 RepID=UPI001F049D51|nr:SAM-dependent methyltransferase [Streptomyces sp. MUM 178J]WRQ80669.1 SAM-dependent methyltransferase [Streptomyces sp. MUM 178J]